MSMLRTHISALALTGTVAAVFLVAPTPEFAVPSCPTVAAVSAAVGSTVTESDFGSCAFKVGSDTISFQIDPSTNVTADMAARRADAVRRTTPVAKIKVGKFAAFTGASEGYSHLYYNQKGTTIRISHFEINAQSADVLKQASTALVKITIPAKIRSCTAIAKAVVGAVGGAKPVPAGAGGCKFELADATTLFVGIQPESFADWFDTYEYTTSDRPPVAETAVGARKGFTYVTSETNLVLPLDDGILTVTLNRKITTPQLKALPAKAAAAIA